MNIYESIAAIMQEIPAIGKEKRNQQQGFMYRGIDDVMNALQPLLSKNKVFVVPEVLEQTREERTTKSGNNLLYSLMKIRYTFYAEDGSNVSAVVIGEGMDSGDKASNKAMAIALKYAFFQVFCIPTEEMKDPDAETPEQSKPAQPAIPICTCDRCKKEIFPQRHKGSGKLYSVAEIIANSQNAYGANLCWSCMKELIEEKASASTSTSTQAGEADENAD